MISSTETKYYLDKDNQKVVVGTPTSTDKVIAYDATKVKLSEITKDGKKYKLVGLKDGSLAESGNVVAGTTEITYVYTLASGGNVFAKYMLEGTTTELAEGKVLKQDASIGEEYTSVAPKAGTLLQKDGKTYFYKGHRATSAPEIGTIDENEKTVIYDFVEYFSEKGEPEVQPELPEGVVSEKGEPEVQPELPEGVVSEKGEPEVQPELPEGVVSEKGEPEVRPELPEGVVSEKGEPEVRPELPEGVVSEKGEPEVRPELPEGVVSEKGEPEVRPELPEGVVSEKGKPEVQAELPVGNGTSPTSSAEVFERTEQYSEETIVSQQKTPQNNTKEIHSNELPKTGQVELLPTWLGFLSLIGGVFVKRKNNKDNF